MVKLNQIVAVVSGKKTQAQKALTEVYKKVQKSDLFQGLVRTYKPVQEDGDTLPPEKTLVRMTVGEAILEVENILTNLLDVVYTQDVTNTKATGNIVVNGNVLAENVPVTYLMFLEKQLVDLHTFLSALPTLDEAYEWRFDDNRDCYVSDAEVKNRDIKQIEHRVVYEATEKHPAQIVEVAVTKKVGEFTTVKLSGAVSVSDKRNMLDKLGKLQEAVKFAREEANSVEVKQAKIAQSLLKYVLN